MFPQILNDPSAPNIFSIKLPLYPTWHQSSTHDSMAGETFIEGGKSDWDFLSSDEADVANGSPEEAPGEKEDGKCTAGEVIVPPVESGDGHLDGVNVCQDSATGKNKNDDEIDEDEMINPPWGVDW